MELKILLVDDEPGALRFLKHAIESRCRGWQVVALAENGRQAIQAIPTHMPDMVLTDIRMPVIDGIQLAGHIREHWPDIRTAFISGYEDFQAAREAIRYGVSDYLLKPVVPDQLVEMLTDAHTELLEQKSRQATALLSSALAGDTPDEGQLARCFHTDRFQVAAVRSGPLPSRYSARLPTGLQESAGNPGGPVEGCWTVAGRDEWERLLFCAAGEDAQPLTDLAQRLGETLPEGTLTVAVQEEPFALREAGDVAAALLRALDHSLVLGEEHLLRPAGTPPRPETSAPVDSELEQQVVHMCTGCCRTKELRELLGGLFDTWQAEHRPLHYVLRDVDRLLTAITRGLSTRRNRLPDHAQQLDSAMMLSASMEELHRRVWDIVLATLRAAEKQDAAPGSESFFEGVKAYIEQNLGDSISLQSLCAAMGISQTYMSRIFRKHTGDSFSEYLTRQRIERAKTLMEERPDLPLKAVAELVGYKDPFYFSKVFRALEGVPPSHFEARGSVKL